MNITLEEARKFAEETISKKSDHLKNCLKTTRYIDSHVVEWRAKQALEGISIERPADIIQQARSNGYWSCEMFAVVHQPELDRFILVG